MSSIVVNIPGCEEVSSNTVNNTITVTAEHCTPPPPPGPPPLIGLPVIIASVIVALASLLATAIVRYKAHEEKGDTRRAEVSAQAKMVEAHHQCDTCGAVYAPALKEEQ